MPEYDGPWQTVYSRFRKWSHRDVFKKLFKSLSSDADMQDRSIDSTSCKTHQHSAGGKKGAENAETNQDIGLSRDGRNTKIHAVVDAMRWAIRLRYTPGNVNDCSVAVDVLSNVEFEGSLVMGDKAYGTKKIRESIEEQGANDCIPPKSKYSGTLGV
jgi:transposase